MNIQPHRPLAFGAQYREPRQPPPVNFPESTPDPQPSPGSQKASRKKKAIAALVAMITLGGGYGLMSTVSDDDTTKQGGEDQTSQIQQARQDDFHEYQEQEYKRRNDIVIQDITDQTNAFLSKLNAGLATPTLKIHPHTRNPYVGNDNQPEVYKFSLDGENYTLKYSDKMNMYSAYDNIFTLTMPDGTTLEYQRTSDDEILLSGQEHEMFIPNAEGNHGRWLSLTYDNPKSEQVGWHMVEFGFDLIQQANQNG